MASDINPHGTLGIEEVNSDERAFSSDGRNVAIEKRRPAIDALRKRTIERRDGCAMASRVEAQRPRPGVAPFFSPKDIVLRFAEKRSAENMNLSHSRVQSPRDAPLGLPQAGLYTGFQSKTSLLCGFRAHSKPNDPRKQGVVSRFCCNQSEWRDCSRSSSSPEEGCCGHVEK
jgi:hypothetical protein